MTDRSVKVSLSLAAQDFINNARKAENATRAIGTAAVEAKTKIGQLGSIPGIASLARDLDKVSSSLRGMSNLQDLARLTVGLRDLSTAAPGLAGAVDQIRRFATAARSISGSSASGFRDIASAVRDLGAGAASLAGVGTHLADLSSGVRRLIRDANSVPAIRALAAALRDLGTSGAGLGNLGNMGNSLRGMQSQIDQLRRSIASLRSAGGGGGGGSGGSSGGLLGGILPGGGVGQLAAYAAGYLAVGSAIKSTFTQTADYETQIATFGAVTNTVGDPLKRVSALALQLGGDVTIAGANAADAAETMTELAKGGLSVADSMTAAKGTLQLASAAGVGFSTAAGIQTAALNEFGLGADQAAKVADTLANTAAAASGEITDFAEGLKQSGTVAHGFGLSLLDNQTILAEFAQAGIKGSMGGNILKSMLLSVEGATGPASKALKDMQVQVKNSDGTYITAAQLQQQLADAKARLGVTAFNADAKVAFGTRGIIGAGIAADQGAKGFDKMESAISDGAGAAAFSQAKMSGLQGAVLNLQNQIETAQVVIGEKFSGAIQGAANAAATAIPKITGFLTGGGLSGGAASIGNFFKPLVDGAGDLISKAWPYIQTFVGSIVNGFKSVVQFVKPVSDSIGNFFKTAAQNGSIDKLGGVLVGIGRAFESTLKFIAPVGKAVGDAVGWFTSLGPVATTAATALLGWKLVGPIITRLFNATLGSTIRSTTGAISGFAGQVRLLQGLTGISRLSATLNVAVGSLANFGKGLLAAFGGPIGLAVTAVTTFLAFLPSLIGGDNSAADAAKNHSDAVNSLADAFQTSNGLIDENVRKTALASLQNSPWGKSSTDLTLYVGQLKSANVSTRTLVDGMLGISGAATSIEDAYNRQKAALQGVIDTGTRSTKNGGRYLTDQALAATQTLGILNQQHDAYKNLIGIQGDATAKARADADAIKAAGATIFAGMTVAAQGYRNSSDAADHAFAAIGSVGAVATKTATPVKTSGQIMSDALKLVSDAASTAATQVSIFQEVMDKLNGIDTTVADAQRASAGALRDIGKAYRDQAAAIQAVADAKAKYKQDLANVGKTNKDGTLASDATTAAQVQADARAITQAEQDKAAAYDNTAQKVEDSRKTVEAEAQSTGKAAIAHGGFAAGLKATIGVYQAQHDAFVKQIVDNRAVGVTVAQATKDAEAQAKAQGLVVDKQKISTAFTKANLDAAAQYGKQLASHKLTMQFGVDLSDALAKYKTWGGLVSLMPKDVKTQFNADVAEAEAHGKELYQVFNKTTGTWQAVFETPGAAGAQVAAGNLVQQYDKAKGTWTAQFAAATAAAKEKALELAHAADIAANERTLILRGLDYASAHIQAVKDALSGIQDKTVTLTVNAVGQSVKVSADGSFTTGSGQKGAATGGFISGPGTSTSDSIAARLSNGEFVVKASATSKHRTLLEQINNNRFADGGFVNTLINMRGTGNIDRTVNSVAGIYSNATSSATVANAAAAAAKAAAAAAVPAASSGVAQWVPLMIKVITEKLGAASVSYVEPIMAAQMQHESGGNPAAINNYDINAQNGDPSRGLLQFIMSTFKHYADPGFNTNIYDPESQMRAFINYVPAAYGSFDYLTRIGNGAYANGGMVHGPGSGRSDSISARLSNGEFVVNAASTARHLPLLSALNGSGFAAGGYVGGSALGLAGGSGPSLGTQASAVAQALVDIAAQVAGARAQSDAKRQAAADSATTLQAKLQAQIDNPKQAAANLAAAQKVQQAETKKTTAHQKAADAARVVSAQAALDKIKATDAANVAKATREHDAAVKSAVAYAKMATAAENAQKAQQGLFHVQQALAAHADQVSQQLADANTNLANLQSARASAAASISSTISGFDGGITGHNDTRTTFATILKGQQYDLTKAATFNGQIAQLKAKGLNAATLNQIASAGIDGGGVTAAALAAATPAQIKQLNGVSAQITKYSNSVGDTAAGATYDAGIQAAKGFAAGFTSQLAGIEKALKGGATVAVSALTKALQIKSPSKVFHVLGQHTVDGFSNGILAGYGKVNDAVSNMVQVPQLPPQGSSGGGNSPNVQISINGSDKLTSVVASMIEVRVDGRLQSMDQTYGQLAMQS